MRVALIGEAWGRSEAQFQHPLVGWSGRELTLQLGEARLAPFMNLKCRKCGKTSRYRLSSCEFCKELIWPNEFDLVNHWKRLREDFGIWVGNVFNEQPKDNDLGHFFGDTPETPMPRADWKVTKFLPGGHSHVRKEYYHHIEKLYSDLDRLRPNLVVCMGNSACWALIGQTKISQLRGTITWSEKLNVKVLPVFHPAAVLRNLVMRPSTITDFRKAQREAEFPEIRRTERWLNILDPTMDAIRFGYEWFSRPARAYANDIETSKGQITIVGFARDLNDALVIPIRNELPDPKYVGRENYERLLENFEPNHWPDVSHEVEAWKLIHYGLRTPQPKIFQNGPYDMSYYLSLGLHPRNPRHDTMLWHHSEYPELPKSLGFLGSIYCNEIPWKQMRRNPGLKRDE